eukprot:jgi/Mesen1/5458/ME000273S04690
MQAFGAQLQAFLAVPRDNSACFQGVCSSSNHQASPDLVAWPKSRLSGTSVQHTSKTKASRNKSSKTSNTVLVSAVLNLPRPEESGSAHHESEAEVPAVRLISQIEGTSAPKAGPKRSCEERIYEAVVKQAAATQREAMADQGSRSQSRAQPIDAELLREAYERCGEVCAEYAKTFYLGTKLMTPNRQKAIWAIYVWCRRTDELVDGPNARHITPRALDRWEERLEDVFNGQPYDMLDAALADTVNTFPVAMQPFRDMIEGMRMDLRKSRYETFDDLYEYCYNVAGTVGLMSVPVMGISPHSKASVESVYDAALALGIANQLTNILRDVGEDSRRGRVYLPQNELAQFGLSDEDIFKGEVTEKWRAFMRFQIKRARDYFVKAEAGVRELDEHSRWPVWASLNLYSQILDAIEANDYNNFTKRAYVQKWKKMLSLPGSYLKAQMVQPTVQSSSNTAATA